MITWLIGDNSYEINQALQKIEATFDGTPEHLDATELTLKDLPDLLMGVSLFAAQRLVVLKGLAQNTSLWDKIPDWISRVSDTTTLVLIDTKVDKRTASYKTLKNSADVHEFPAWQERDASKAEHWLVTKAQHDSIKLAPGAAKSLVQRVGADQWRLAQALETLALLGEVTPTRISEVVPLSYRENVFELFETALKGDLEQALYMLDSFKLQQDPFSIFALISSQAVSLAGVSYAGPGDNPAKELDINPWVASKLARYGKMLGGAKVARIVNIFAKTDADLKLSKASPWLLIEQALIKTTQTIK